MLGYDLLQSTKFTKFKTKVHTKYYTNQSTSQQQVIKPRMINHPNEDLHSDRVLQKYSYK